MNGLALVLALAVAQAAQTPAAAERPVAEPAAAAPDGTAPKQAPSAVPAVAERRGPASADPTASPLVRPDGATEVKAAPRTRRAPTPSPTTRRPISPPRPLVPRRAATCRRRRALAASRPPPRPRPRPSPSAPRRSRPGLRRRSLRQARCPSATPRSAWRAPSWMRSPARTRTPSRRLRPSGSASTGSRQAGRDAIRRTWRNLLAARAPAASRPAIGRVEVLSAADATARFGKPPARIAPLARGGVLVVVGEVGGRTVVLFLGREAGRMAVLGMHD